METKTNCDSEVIAGGSLSYSFCRKSKRLLQNPDQQHSNNTTLSAKISSRFKKSKLIQKKEASNEECKLDIEVSDENRFRVDYYNKNCIVLAKNLLGKVLVRKLPSGVVLKGMIVETESYLGFIDKASHSYQGKMTKRNEAMFLPPGTAYVYSIYGMYYCFNISSLEAGSAVLVRALRPLLGFSHMQEMRSKNANVSSITPRGLKQLCNGPSKLCQAFQIDKDSMNKVDLSACPNMWIEDGEIIEDDQIVSSERIGIKSAGEEWANKPLRFYIRDCTYVSKPHSKS